MLSFLAIGLWDYTTFGLYMLASLVLGLMAGGKQKDLKTYLLAGHQMHWALIAISVLAALFSGISFVGAPSETFSHNLVYLWSVVAFLVATPITNKIFLPFFFRLPYYTAYEYLEHRFDLRLRRLSSASFIFRVSLWLALAQFAPSLVISEVTGIPLWVAIVVTGGVTILYTTVGGMRAVIYTDVMQFAVLLAGIIAVLFVALARIPGGVEGAWQIASEGGRTQFLDFSLSVTDRMTVWGAFFGGIVIALVALVTDQVSVQRYLTAASLRECQRALWLKFWLTLPLVGIFYFTGLVLYAFYQTHPGTAATLSASDRVLPHFVMQHLGSPMPGLLVASILAATMSTVSAGINSLTTATMMDFLRYHSTDATSPQEEARRVRQARYWTVFYGVMTSLVAMVISRLGTVVEASNKISGFFGGPLLGIFVLGVFSRRANALGVLIGAGAGFAAVVGVGLWTSVSFMWYALVGLLVTTAVGEIASRFFPEPEEACLLFTRSALLPATTEKEAETPEPPKVLR